MISRHVLFLSYRKFLWISYKIKSPPGKMRTQMQRKYIADATHLRRRISQSEILSCLWNPGVKRVGCRKSAFNVWIFIEEFCCAKV